MLTPLGNDAILRRADRRIDARAFDWGETVEVGPLRVHFEPALHWSARGRGDRRMALWASFVIEGARQKIYFAGDTGYGDGSLFPRHSPDITDRCGSRCCRSAPMRRAGSCATSTATPTRPSRSSRLLEADFAFACHWGDFPADRRAL